MAETAGHQWHVMISSTMNDLQAERQAAWGAILAAGMDAWWAEAPPQQFAGLAPQDFCRRMAEQCDLFLLILGPRYGYRPDGQPAGIDQSVTHMEYDWARARSRRKILVFVQQGAEFTADLRQRHFIDEVLHFSTGYTRFPPFATPEQLGEQVGGALAEWRQKQLLGLQRYLVTMRDRYATFFDPLTGGEREIGMTVLLQMRSETEARTSRRSWDEMAGASPFADISAQVARREVERREEERERREAGGRDQEAEKREGRAASRAPIVDTARNLLDRFSRLVVIGDPGAGKTTLLHRLAHDLAQSALDARADAHTAIPVLATAVELGRLLGAPGRPPSLAEAIERVAADARAPEADLAVRAAFARGEVIVLVDGLDEVGQDQARRAILGALQEGIGRNRGCLTSRAAAYQENALPGWRDCEVQQLDTTRRRTLMTQVIEQVSGQASRPIQRDVRALEYEVDHRDDLRVWAGNPLLLTLVSTQYARNGKLPEERAKVYRLAVEELIDSPHRPIPPTPRLLERDVVERVLQFLGWTMLEHGLASATEEEIAHLAAREPGLISGDAIPEFLDRAGVLQVTDMREPRQWGFVHLTFRDYFAAAALANLDAGRTQVVVRHRLSARWEQTTQLLVGELDRLNRHDAADSVVEALVTADARPVKQLRGSDPLHLSLARAARCQSGRAEPARSAGPGPRLRQRWLALWSAAVRYRPPRLVGDAAPPDNYLEDGALEALGADVVPVIAGRLRIQPRDYGWVYSLFILIENFLLTPALLVAAILGNVGNRLAASLLPILVVLVVGGYFVASPVARRATRRAGEWCTATRQLARLDAVGPAAVPPLAATLDYDGSNASAVHLAAIEALAHVGGDAAGALPALVRASRSANPTLRRASVRALGQLGATDPAEPYLVKMLSDDPVAAVRAAAAEALGDLHALEALSALRAALHDADESVQAEAARAIGRLGAGAGAALPDLQAAMGGDSFLVRDAAVHALRQIAPEAAPTVEQLASVLRDLNPSVRARALEALWTLGVQAAPAFAAIKQALHDPYASVRWRAIHALVQLGPISSPALQELRAARLDPDVDVREEVPAALASLGATEAPVVADLRAALRDPSWRVRLAAARAIGTLGPAAAPLIGALQAALDDRDADVRAAALNALAALGSAAEPASRRLRRELRAGAWLGPTLRVLLALPTVMTWVVFAAILLDQVVVLLPPSVALRLLSGALGAFVPRPALRAALQQVLAHSIWPWAVALVLASLLLSLAIGLAVGVGKLGSDVATARRSAACRALAALGRSGGAALRDLLGALRDSEGDVRRAAALALQHHLVDIEDVEAGRPG